MKIEINEPPREYKVGISKEITIRDCAKISLVDDEQVTFFAGKKEYDFTRKKWGFYATPSMNGRLKRHGFKSALVKNEKNLYFIMIVENFSRGR